MMREATLIVLILAVCACVPALRASTDVPRVCRAVVVEAAPTVTDMDRLAPEQLLTDFVDGQTGESAAVQSRAAVFQDAGHLYVAVECLEPSMGTLQASARPAGGEDANVFPDDCVEIFVGPREPSGPYYHFALNPLGAGYDEQNKDPLWNGNWDAAAGRADDRWWVVLALPFPDIGGPRSSADVWHLNVSRQRRAAGETQLSSWSDTGERFHDVSRFGRLAFGDSYAACLDQSVIAAARTRAEELAETGDVSADVLLAQVDADLQPVRAAVAAGEIETGQEFARLLLLGEAALTALERAGYTAHSFLPNSSFEIAANPSHPDCWGSSSAPEMMPYEDATLDYTDAYQGEASVRLTMRPNPHGRRGRGWRTNLIDMPELQEDTRFVLSAYIKTNVPGSEAYLYVQPGDPEVGEFEVTEQWQRYWVSFVVTREQAQARKQIAVEFGPKTESGTYAVWFDAMQLEIGEEPTEYSPSDYDLSGGQDAVIARQLAEQAEQATGIECERLALSYGDRLDGLCDAVFYLRNRDDGQRNLTVSVDIQRQGEQGGARGSGTVAVTALPGDQRVTIPSVSFPIEPKNDVRYHTWLEATLTVTDADSGEQAFSQRFERRLIPPLFEAIAVRDYYTTEGSASVIGLLNGVPDERLSEFGMRVEFGDGGPAGAETPALAAQETEVQIPIADLAPGEYPCTVTLTHGGEDLLTVQTELVKREPAAVEVKLDRQRRCLVVDDQAFIPYFFGMHAPQDRPHMWQEMAEQGFNGCITSFDMYNVVGDNETILAGLDEAQALGLKVMVWLFQRATPETGDLPHWEVSKNYARRIIPAIKDHPAVVGYMIADEWWDLVYSSEVYDLVKELDPYKPAFHTQCSGFWSWENIGDWHPRWAETVGANGSWWELDSYFTDLIAWDVYAFGRDKPPGLEALVDDSIKQVAQVMAAPDRKPMLFWGQALYYGSEPFFREPTAREETGEFYQLLINGLRGEMYFYYKPEARELWERYGQQAAELKALDDVLLSPDASADVYSTNPDVRLVAKQVGDTVYVISSNISSLPAETRIVLDGVTAGECSVMFEDRSVEIDAGAIADGYEGFERHVYRLQ